ncbi:MAG TPA: hypothetical protein VNZ52_09655 [Candidatus Thermoplasmatota archaeon]|nr:hypothetical protein [Candidatus Thermoplasmatota archaeon]
MLVGSGFPGARHPSPTTAGAVDPGTTLMGLAVYGSLGLITLYLLWRSRERDREHAEERRQAWQGVEMLREEQQRGNETLIRIETLLKPR